MRVSITIHFEDIDMHTTAEAVAKIGELTAAVAANSAKTAKEIADLTQAAADAKAAEGIPDDAWAQLQAAIDALNA